MISVDMTAPRDEGERGEEDEEEVMGLMTLDLAVQQTGLPPHLSPPAR